MADDLSSEFDYSEEKERKKRRLDLAVPTAEAKIRVADKASCSKEWHKEDRKQQFLAVDPYSRHKLLVNEYLLYYPGATKVLQRDTSRDRTDIDVIRENSKFLWSDTDEPASWEAKLAKRYYDKLFKEYCIADLSRYKENKMALRWRTEKEVISGKGQFVCGEKKCNEKSDLTSWEVNFAYVEDGTKKNALVKLRLCIDCSYKLNYHHKKHKVVKSSKKTGSKKIKSEPESDVEIAKEKLDQSTSSDEQRVKPVVKENETELWQKPPEVDEEKSREDEFEEFLDDLFV